MPGETSNPYDTDLNESASHIIGRPKETHLMERVLVEGKRPPHRLKNFLVTAEPGVGKATLLGYYRRIAAREHYLVVEVDAANHKPARSKLVSLLHDMLKQIISQAEQLRPLDDPSMSATTFDDVADLSLSKLALSGVPLDTGQLQALSTLEFPTWYYAFVHNPNAEISSSPLAPWIKDVRNTLRLAEDKAGAPGCVITVDNVDTLSNDDVRILLDAIRGIHETLSGCRVSFALAGTPHLRRHILQRQRGVAYVFLDLRLAEWGFNEVAEYVKRPELLEHHITMPDDEVIQRLLEDTGGSPVVLRLLCARIFDACKASGQHKFEPTESVIEQVCTEIEGVSNLNVIDAIKKAGARSIGELSEIVPFIGWTIPQIVRLHNIEAWITGKDLNVPALEQRLDAIATLYRNRGILKRDAHVMIQGSSLELAYLRLWARKFGIQWAPQFRDRVLSYDEWVELATRTRVVEYSNAVGFPLKKWATWHVPSDDLPRTLEERAAEYLTSFREGTAQPPSDQQSTMRMKEEGGRLTYKLIEAESPLRDLASPHDTVTVDLLALGFQAEDRSEQVVQLYRMPASGSVGLDQVLSGIGPLTSLLGLRTLEHWQGHVELPSLSTLVHRATQQRNSALLRECLYACIAVGRVDFDRLDVDKAWEWFSLAAQTPEDLIQGVDLANAKNGLAFVSIAKGRDYWPRAEADFEWALKRYSTDVTRSNRAMTRYDIGYLQAATQRLPQAEKTCQDALSDVTAQSGPGFLFVKLCEIDGLHIDQYVDMELARSPRVDAAIYCTLGYIYAMQDQTQQAEGAFSEALRRDNKHYMVYRALGHYQLRRNRVQDAMRSFERARECYDALIEERARTPDAIPLGALPALEDELDFTKRLLSNASGRRG